jgi:hypothetical protein
MFGLILCPFGAFLLLGSIMPEDGSGFTPLSRVGLFVFGLALIAAGVHVFRGKSQALKDFDAWHAIQMKKNQEWMAQPLMTRLGFGSWSRSQSQSQSQTFTGMGGSPFPRDDVTVAQVNAVANPDTSKALQNLQNLLYTHAITDAEFQAAKDTLLRSSTSRADADTFAHIEKLVELHQAGILGDVEFQVAKLKALGLA